MKTPPLNDLPRSRRDLQRPHLRTANALAQRTSAFTLVELLVVMVLIAILAALLLPALSRAKAQAQSAGCKNNLRQMGIALQLYTEENRGFFPCWWNFNPVETNTIPWAYMLKPYYRLDWSQKSYHCPAYRAQIVSVASAPAWTTPGTVTYSLSGSYAYNKGGTEPFGGGNFQSIAQGGSGSIPQSDMFLGLSGAGRPDSPPAAIAAGQIKSPSDMFAIADSRIGTWLLPLSSEGFGEDWMLLGVTPYEIQAPRHGNGINVICCDAHVSHVRFSDFIDPRKTGANYNNDHEAHPETWSMIQLP